MTKTTIHLQQLRTANVQRADQHRDQLGGHILEDWSPTDIACALAGETGELCNLIKKLRRGDQIDKLAVADELADVLIYLDLLAARMGIDLAAAVVSKFNRTSCKVKSSIVLTPTLP